MEPSSGPLTSGDRADPDWSKVLAVFEALSRPARLAVFRRLVRAGEEGVDATTLIAELRTTGSALTLHLRHLSEAGLVQSRGGRAGRFTARLDRLEAAMRVIESAASAAAAGPQRQ